MHNDKNLLDFESHTHRFLAVGIFCWHWQTIVLTHNFAHFIGFWC
jgi:hypothetical protein